MVDLTDFLGADKQRASLVKKRVKAQENLDKLMVCAKPIETEISMYDKMIAAIDDAIASLGVGVIEGEGDLEPMKKDAVDEQ